MTDTGQSIIDMPVGNLQPNPLQPRGSITHDSIEDLVDSIKQYGILEPLVVAQTPAGYQIIAGERRWRAAKSAGLETVPVVIKRTSPRGMLEMAIVENVQRSDLNAIDRAKAFERLMIEFNLSTSEIAQRVSKSSAYVSNSLRLLKLPDALTDGLLSGLISEGHARALSGIDDPKAMIEAYKIILKENGSVRRAEELARRHKADTGTFKKEMVNNPQALITSKELDQMQQDIQKALGENSNVKLKRTVRETKIQIVLKGNVEKTQFVLDQLYGVMKDLKVEQPEQ